MSDVRSDAFVFFGATGDLAYKKIFPALQADGEARPPRRGQGQRREAPRPRSHGVRHTVRPAFAREDYVEEAGRIVDPVLKSHTPVHEYEPGTWEPKEVDARVSPLRGWQNPRVKKP